MVALVRLATLTAAATVAMVSLTAFSTLCNMASNRATTTMLQVAEAAGQVPTVRFYPVASAVAVMVGSRMIVDRMELMALAAEAAAVVTAAAPVAATAAVAL